MRVLYRMHRCKIIYCHRRTTSRTTINWNMKHCKRTECPKTNNFYRNSHTWQWMWFCAYRTPHLVCWFVNDSSWKGPEGHLLLSTRGVYDAGSRLQQQTGATAAAGVVEDCECISNSTVSRRRRRDNNEVVIYARQPKSVSATNVRMSAGTSWCLHSLHTNCQRQNSSVSSYIIGLSPHSTNNHSLPMTTIHHTTYLVTTKVSHCNTCAFPSKSIDTQTHL